MTKQLLPAPPADYPFESKYATVKGHRIHYIAEGQGDPVLFIHGNPTSSYVWRNILVPVARKTDRRVIALDLLGFGRSENPASIEYTLDLHAEIVAGFIGALELHNVVLVAEDWGGPLGVHWAVRNYDDLKGMVLMETFLWPMSWTDDFAPQFRTPFRLMRSPLGFVLVQVMNMMVKKLIPENCPISRTALDRYIADLPTIRSRKAMRAFPNLLPIDGEPRASLEFFREIEAGLKRIKCPVAWLKPTPGIVLSDDFPPSLKRLDWLRERIPQIDVRQYGPGHHFLAEEEPERLARVIADAIRGMK